MTPTHTISTNQFPAPHRAPQVLDELAAERSDQAESLSTADRDRRRRQRSFDGWLASRIRKQSRHWRKR
jgi:hypothetical protein